MSDFTKISKNYLSSSRVQKSAGEKLISLLDIRNHEDILDVGCGTGNLTARLKSMTRGEVMGIDPSIGMIREAGKIAEGSGVRFEMMAAEQLEYRDCFDVIFCNSVFQWIQHPENLLPLLYRALRPGGRIGVQSPAGKRYSPNFLDAIEYACQNRKIQEQFAAFRAPWTFLETEDAYKELFRESGFQVLLCDMIEEHEAYSAGDVYKIFNSGAAAGYLNPQYYMHPFPPDFRDAFLQKIRESFKQQADRSGKMDLVFYRIYLIGMKK
jgi:trans-aconitate 2-methyltransferase